MAIVATTDSVTQGAVDEGAHTVAVTLNGSYTGNGGAGQSYVRTGFQWYWSGNEAEGPVLGDNSFGYTNYDGNFASRTWSYIPGETLLGGYIVQSALIADTSHTFRARVLAYEPDTLDFRSGHLGDIVGFKSNAVTPVDTAGGSASSITASTATLAFTNFAVNTAESTATATIELRVYGSGAGYATVGSTGSLSGYGAQSVSHGATGLLGSTTYEYRLRITRTTNNVTSFTTAGYTFTTSAGAPTVTTGEASSVGANSATFNAELDANSISTTLFFEYGTTLSYGTAVAATPSSSSSDVSFSASVGSLTAATLYHFRAYGTYTGGTALGADATFTTAADPLAAALQEDHLTIQEYDAVYGVQKAFVFLAASPAATSSDKFLSAASPWATTECRITKDGGTVADTTNAPTRIGTSAFFTITLTATEMQAENVWVHISDASNAARDVALHVRTSQELGKSIISAVQYGSNNSAVSYTGVGTGYGLTMAGGTTATADFHGRNDSDVMRTSTATAGGASTITLDSGASVTDDYYNGAVIMITSGTGSGQARVITDYAGSTLVATVNRAWSTNPASGSKFVIVGGSEAWDLTPGVELAALPTSASSFGKLLQFIFQRHAFKRTMTATTFTTFKADSSTTLATGAVADDGTTETAAKLS